MHTLIRRGLYGCLVAGGLIVLGAGAASAEDNQTSGRHGLLSGNQVVAHVNAPVTVAGNAISGIGDSSSSRQAAPSAAATASSTPAGSATTSGRRSVGSGNQVIVPVRAPITIRGNAISGIGDSSVTTQAHSNPAHPGSQAGTVATSGRRGILSGNQVAAPVNAPVTVGGNAASVVGDSSVAGSGTGGGSTAGSIPAGSPLTSGDRGVGSGNQVIAPVNAPVTVGGNAVSVVGDSSVVGSGPGSAGSPGGSTPAGSTVTSGDRGVGSGNQVIAPVNAPVTVGGNAASVVGDSSVVGSGPGSAGTPGGSTPVGSPVTSGDRGILSGNQVIAPVNAPVTVGGNAVSVIGDSSVVGSGPGGGSTGGSTPPGDTQPGDGSSGGGSSGGGSSGGGSAGDGSSSSPGANSPIVSAASAMLAALATTGANMLLPLGIALLLLMFGALLMGLTTTRRRVALLA